MGGGLGLEWGFGQIVYQLCDVTDSLPPRRVPEPHYMRGDRHPATWEIDTAVDACGVMVRGGRLSVTSHTYVSSMTFALRCGSVSATSHAECGVVTDRPSPCPSMQDVTSKLRYSTIYRTTCTRLWNDHIQYLMC